jgi:hypothetical protein
MFLASLLPSLLLNSIFHGKEPITKPFAMANLGGILLFAKFGHIPLRQQAQVA